MLFVFGYPLAGAAIPSLKQHIKRRQIYYVDCKVNLCIWTAYSFITMSNSKDKRWIDCSRIAEAKGIFSRINRVDFRDNYQGFEFVRDIENFINKEQINVHMYTFEDNLPHYELTQNYLVNGSNKQFNILFNNDGINAHIMYTSDVEALTGFRYQKKVNEKFGDSSQVTATLIPFAIASIVKLASGIYSFYYDIRTEDFLDNWLEQIFEEAKQVKKDNKYLDETIPQYYEVSVIRFNSAKFDASILFKNLKSKDWTISKYQDQNTIAKLIIVKHQSSCIQLIFANFKIYSMQHKLKDTVRDFGNGQYKKYRFPHEFININNYMNELNKCEPIPIEAFDNKLRNKKLSEDKYKDYQVEAAKHKSRWDYLKHFNIFDIKTIICHRIFDCIRALRHRYIGQ
ncbi:MAG: hypothetical protein EZS28_039002, partial [Streblomastix strix]